MRVQIAVGSCAVGTVFLLQSCIASFPHDRRLEAELAQRSQSEGLAILTTESSGGVMPVAYFNQRSGELLCCGSISSSWVVLGGRGLVTVDYSRPGIADLTTGNANAILSNLTPNLILFDLNGVEKGRYGVRIKRASFVAVSAGGKNIAFVGEGGPAPATGADVEQRLSLSKESETGLLFGRLDSVHFNKVYSLPKHDHRSVAGDQRPETVAWSPDGRAIVYGKDGEILIYDLQTNSSRVVAKGTNPMWSPNGDQISYRGPNGEAMLIEPSGQNPREILKGRTIQHALHWSPDGRYLLLTLLTQDIVPWASLAVYRLSDGAITAIGESGLSSLDDSHREWVIMGPQP